MKFLFALLVPITSFAATTEFDIQAQLLVDGKLVASPRVLSLPGEAAELSQSIDTSPNKLRVRIIATDDNHKIEDGIFLKFEIYYRNGTKIVEASPELLAKPGEEVSLKLGKKEQQNVELKVRATRL